MQASVEVLSAVAIRWTLNSAGKTKRFLLIEYSRTTSIVIRRYNLWTEKYCYPSYFHSRTMIIDNTNKTGLKYCINAVKSLIVKWAICVNLD
jgi:hypothetical protein